ncbi:hypothetical protein [Lentzea roselyniae]
MKRLRASAGAGGGGAVKRAWVAAGLAAGQREPVRSWNVVVA